MPSVDTPAANIVQYYLYLHGDGDAAWEAAKNAGFSDEEIQRLDLGYVGYEEKMRVTVNRKTGKVVTSIEGT